MGGETTGRWLMRWLHEVEPHALAPICVALLIGGLAPSGARAGDRIEVVVTESIEDDGNETAVVPGTAAPPGSAPTTHTVEVVEHAEPTRTETTWFGLSLGVVTAPLSRAGPLPATRRLNANPMHACFGSGDRQACTALRGADVRVQFYSTRGATYYPRVIGYLRTGYELGQGALEPGTSGDFEHGDATAVAYVAVPVFLGVSLYAFKQFPVRPFVGGGMGADILRLRYTRHEEAARRDTAARFGVEVHAGLEARLTNYVALTAEVKQQWGARRKVADMPAFANTGLTVMAGLAISLPQATSVRHNHAARVTTVTRMSSPVQPAVGPRTRFIFGSPIFTAPVAPTPTRTIVSRSISVESTTPAPSAAVAPSPLAPTAVVPSAGQEQLLAGALTPAIPSPP